MRQIIESVFGRRRVELAAVAAVAFAVAISVSDVQGAHRLVSEQAANHLGLTRAWFTQVQLDPARDYVQRAVLKGDRLTVITSAGVVQELNALTGQTYWTAPIGHENYPSLGPAANDKYVAVLNGSVLYVLDRNDGKPVMVQTVGGAPGAAPALAEKYVFVPLLDGRIEGYSLEKTKQRTPWHYQSSGKATVAPLATPESIVWTTDAGYLYVGNSDNLTMRYRLETGSEIEAPPSYHQPYVYVASLSGELFAMHELTGTQQWKYATGFPVKRAAAAVGNRVFVTSIEPALHCIDASTGKGLWLAPHVAQFAAASRDRVYGVDDLGAFVVLNAATGEVLARAAGERPINALVNDQTDRVYLIAHDGMIQCFHEIGAKVPLYHNPKPVAPKEKGASVEKSTAPMPPKPAARPKAARPTERPKTKEEKKPAEKGNFGVGENPFG
ncbi:MAG TPA: PQQ-binding-like beta-propeller repeat protein [Lacipirellulaceae bacterium]|nr:PQQ-binding-like beta-propeller repeat protein [Lacipirellulaceae bacterium]